MSFCIFIFTVGFLCIIQQINGHSYEETLASYRSYAPHSDSNITKVNLVPYSSELKKTYSDEIPSEKKKDFESVLQSYISYQQPNERNRRSYNTYNRSQNRRLNSTGRVDNFKTHEMYNTNLLSARNNATWNRNVNNRSVHCCNSSNLQRRRQDGMFLNTTAPVRKINSSHNFNYGSSYPRDNRTYSSNSYNYQLNNRSHPYRINNTSLNNRWFRKKRSQPNSYYNTLSYINQEQLSKHHQAQVKYSKLRHIKKRELNNNLVVEDNSKYTLSLLKKLTTPTILSTTKQTKIKNVFMYDEVKNMHTLPQFTTLSTENKPHDDTVLIQVPPRAIHCSPRMKFANGRCRHVW
uniref:Putative secreted protein n=1 Tax=Rhodnius neglectus TaxID=72488 RepID=A0A0P4VK97_9HEMI